ncbi:MAG: carboxypeptidase regulatory-like domain-containing protein [Euryarchaeota archaeon]|nr:carboxypeptidase regulatory-like domain-containing protein [Euryarchaeota archaeon]
MAALGANRSVLVVALLIAGTFAGCIASDTDPAGRAKGIVTARTVRILGPEKAPIANAQVTAHGESRVLAVLAADVNGVLEVRKLPPGTVSVTIGAPGHTAQSYALKDLPSTILLKAAEAVEAAKGILAFRKSVNLLCNRVDHTVRPAGYKCGDFGEPVVEVAGDGAIWASATCCVGPSPPIWVSRDGGITFKVLDGEGTGVVRDAAGIEGDFAIDDAGNVYFFDILAGTSYFTSYTAAGKHRHTALWPYEPLVDRPWVRAGKADEVFVIYNTGTATAVYSSTNGGLTWQPQPLFKASCGLGVPGQGPSRDRLFIVACGSAPKIWISKDAGKTWAPPLSVPMPEIKLTGTSKGTESFMPPVSDEAGNIYVPFTHYMDAETQQKGLWVARLNPDLSWAGPFLISGIGQNSLPWPAASRDGQFAVAWYHTDVKRPDIAKAEWKLHVAASVDASGTEPHFQTVVADPDVLRTGQLGRALGDFLESDLTPDGRFVVVYGHRATGGFTNRFVSSDGGLDLSFAKFLNGPKK